MDYSFNVEVAQKYGVNEAIFMHNLYFWIFKNEANERHFYDGRYWTYNSAEAFSKLFPFWSADQIKRLIKKLRDSGHLCIGNFNQNQFNRTSWYALSDEIINIYKGIIPSDNNGGENPLFDSAKSHNGECDFAPIHSAESHFLQTDINHIVNTDIKPDKPTGRKKGKFIKPTLAEVAEYCRQRQNNVDPKRFFDYYDTAGWVDSKGDPVRNWKQKMIANWESNRGGNARSSPDLDGDADEMMTRLYGGRR